MTKEKQLAEVKDFPVVTAEDVRKFFCEKATEKEVAMFLQIAKHNNLNPFLREIYIVKYGSYPASILTGYEVYLKRAERSGKYAGFKVWVEGNVPDMKACIEVPRKDWEKPLYHEVHYAEYVGKKADGKPTRFWSEKPITMLKKVVISQAFRYAFPDELAGMPYTQDEINTQEHEVIHKQEPITVPEVEPESPQTAVRGSNLNESADLDEVPFGEPDKPNTGKCITYPQQKRLFAIAKKFGWTEDSIKSYLKVSHNLESTKEIPMEKYEGIISFLSTPDESK